MKIEGKSDRDTTKRDEQSEKEKRGIKETQERYEAWWVERHQI
jgi:hypothetical protein